MPGAEDLRNFALSFPESEEQPHFHRSAFKVRKKIFCTLDESKGSAVVKLTEIDQSAFCSFDTSMVYPVPGAWGKQGWTEFRLDGLPTETMKDLITTAYLTVAPVGLRSVFLENNPD